MPPHDDLVTINNITDTREAWLTNRPLDVRATIAGTTDRWTANEFNIIDYIDNHTPRFVTDEDLEKFEKNLIVKLYRIISENTKIDIPEDEFMKLLIE